MKKIIILLLLTIPLNIKAQQIQEPMIFELSTISATAVYCWSKWNVEVPPENKACFVYGYSISLFSGWIMYVNDIKPIYRTLISFGISSLFASTICYIDYKQNGEFNPEAFKYIIKGGAVASLIITF